MSLMIYSYGFAIFFFVFWCGVWVIHVIALSYGKWKLHKKVTKRSLEQPLPGVSILKPLLGVDPNLYGNLETFFTQDYPLYELLFCVEEESDPAIMIVRNLIEKYPQINARLFIGGDNVGVNPKINNMSPGYDAARYEFLMISDSGIRLKSDTLLDMVNHMKDNVALVHQMPFTHDRDGFPAALEKIYFGTFQARIYLAADILGFTCHTGMSSLFRKKLLDEVGGLRTFGIYLAEDFFLSKSLTDRGWRTTVSSQPALQNSGYCRIDSFQERLTRWSKLRLAMVPTTIIFEPLSECIILGLLTSWSVEFLFDWDPIIFVLLHMLVWFLLDWLMLSIVQNGSLPFNKLEFLIGWIISEISGPAIIFKALWDPVVRWRTRVFRLKWGGVAEEIVPKIKL